MPIELTKLPRHVAIIMDGNGRWAAARGMPRIKGHEAGAESVSEIVRDCRERGISALTLYSFSTENWKRPSAEVGALMGLLERYLAAEKKEILDKEYVPFSEGMKENGYSDRAIKTLWDILVPFSDYAFNKAHTAAYGLISYWTAYLKEHYAPEYMAALLTSVKDDKDKMAIYLNECRRMKIQVLPPDVNESASNFTPVGRDIRFGLTAIRNVGGNVVDGIVRGTSDGRAVLVGLLGLLAQAVARRARRARRSQVPERYS